MSTSHNHGPDWGRVYDDCPRCQELQAKPYVLTYKLSTDKRIQRIPVSTVDEAQAITQEKLNEAGVCLVLRPFVVTNPSGRDVVAILTTRPKTPKP